MVFCKLGAVTAHSISVARTKSRALGSVSTAALIVAAATSAANAQTPAPQTGQAPAVEEIVVTGSRIVRDGYEAPTPVSVIGADAFQASGQPQIADFVNQLPSLAGSATPTATAVSSGLQGLALLNLRALGSNRTLVLLDGQRSVASAVTGQVDVNNIPQSLVSRVDVVTGGASAAYGSDALSGVVNFVLDKNFTGIKGSVEGGVTTYGDDRSWKVSITGGTPFAGDRGHFLFSAEANHTDGILDNTRAWNEQGWKVIVNPAYSATNGNPQYLVRTQVGLTSTPGGNIVSGPLKGIAFGPGGTPYQFNYGSISLDPYTVGGDWRSSVEDTYQSLDSLVSSEAVFARAAYDITDDINAFVQLSWNRTFAFDYDARQYNVGNISIKADNAFIPSTVAAQVQALKLTSLTIGTFSADIGPFATDNNRITNRYVTGANGKFDAFDTGWTWDGYYQKGITRAAESIYNTTVKSSFALAIDAVRGPNGTIVCRSTLTNPTNGCVPWNVFGIGVNSQAAKNYIENDAPHRDERFVEDAFALNVRGEPFSDWAGPVSVALGAEHRYEGVSGIATANDQASNFFVGNFLPNFGHYTVTEGYVETVIPLAKDTVWARSFDLNAAVRATSYSVSGYVTTWKIGATWAPIDDIRVRATRSRDIRAPNLSDLFAAGTANTNGVLDPFNNNAQTQYTGFAIGNINLKPEEADTTGLGVVVQPQFFPGFSASLDWYNIDIGNAIGSLAAQDIVNLCYAGQQQYCGVIVRGQVNGVNLITRIYLEPFNFVTQTASGLDMEASYRTRLDTFVSSWSGGLTLRVLATHFLKNYSNNGISPATDSVGSNGGSGPPNWRYLASLSYDGDPINVSLTARGLSGGTISNTWIQCTSGCPAATANNPTVDYNHVNGETWYDLSLSYKFMRSDSGADAEAFLTIRNLMNSDPAVMPQGPSGSSYKAAAYNFTLYDGIGRTFRAGIRFKM